MADREDCWAYGYCLKSCDCDDCAEYSPHDISDSADTRKALERLAAYEDTGLEPEEITRLKSERDAAVEDMRMPVCLACGKYRVTCRPKRDKLADGCQTFTWRGPQKETDG